MNKNIKGWQVFAVVLAVCTGVYFGCSETITNPDGRSSQTDAADQQDIPDIQNIIWTLNKSGYAAFRLIFNDDRFFGYDGCNWYGARYAAQNDSIFPVEVSQTERGCNVSTFPVQNLARSFELVIAETELRITTDLETLIFKSKFTAPIEDSPLLGNWTLSASSDPDFDDMKERELIPMLTFNGNRGFEITWMCTPDNLFGCDQISGIFGIGADDEIVFYETAWKTHAQGLDFMERILHASTYRIAIVDGQDTILTLFNKATGTVYELSPVSNASQSDRALTFD